MENRRWKTDSSPLCVARKPWRGSPSGPSEESAYPTLPTSGPDQLVPKTITEQALQITVDSEEFLEHFFERADVASGAAVSEGAATFTLLDGTKTKGFGIETIVKVSVALGEKIVTAAVARWLLEKLSPSAGHIKYHDVIYQINTNIEDLTRLIERLKADQQDLQ
jgi:hypothetical protein